MKATDALLGAVSALVIAFSSTASAQQTQEWSPAQVQQILEKTQSIRLAPDLSHLSADERAAVDRLLQVGAIFQDIYETQRHRGAIEARQSLLGRRDALAPQLYKLYRLNQGPVAVTLDNKRVPFVAVDAPPPGKNVYPWDLTKAEIDAYIAANPAEKAGLTHLRSVVRRADAASLRQDLA
ncbi:hypothetical protein, partial [uncultured Sphingomonas sp.]|uniref:hypothetical protein n=1 Tax=uncultured Sphingomonas sp. TaxID=158754 RepID=UPI0025D0F667